MTKIGEALVQYLEAQQVDIIFGIPGVHTIELYRGLAKSSIRHITSRHEQGAGFMADAFARVSGKPGVAFVITGPGMSNILTAVAQARADSVPILIVSGVNEQGSLGLGLGHLHELPDQQALCSLVACSSVRIRSAEDLVPALNQIFTGFSTQRPGPVHIEIPIDVMGFPYPSSIEIKKLAQVSRPVSADIARAVKILAASKKPLILAGGGTRGAAKEVQALAESLDAPVVLTTNARGLLHKHPLCVPASGSLHAVRRLITDAEIVLALGTELGTTDYDMYRDGGFPEIPKLIRVDICDQQIKRHVAEVGLAGDSAAVVTALLSKLSNDLTRQTWPGADIAAKTRLAAQAALSADYRHLLDILNTIRDTMPGSLIIGDSTQLIYAGNLYYDHDRVGGWFNSATGYGALGYAIPAAIGAAFAVPDETVICLTGDGGAQFSLSELMTASQEKLSIIFIIWNNRGYLEIEKSMVVAEVDAFSCDMAPPDFEALAVACAMPFYVCSETTTEIRKALKHAAAHPGPVILEVRAFHESDDT